MACFALAKGDGMKAYNYYWEMPVKNLWYLLWGFYKYNDVKVNPIERDSTAIIDV